MNECIKLKISWYVLLIFSWGHSGYEELYPDEFQQGNGNEIESDERYYAALENRQN
jgi:hypothetical protein